MKFPTIFLVRGGGHASKHPSFPPCATKTHFWPPKPSEGDASSASAQHSRSRDKEGGDFPRRAVDWRLRSRGRQWALRRDRAALSLRQISAHIWEGRLHQAGDQIFCSPSPEACRPLTQGKPAPGRNRRGYEAESAPCKVTADPGRGKDHPRPSSHPEMSQGPGQRLGNLYTWDCTSADLYRQEVSSPGCGLLLRNGHLVGDRWGQQAESLTEPSAEQTQQQAEESPGYGGEEAERGRQVHDCLWSSYKEQPWHPALWDPVCFTDQRTQSLLSGPVPLTETGSTYSSHTLTHTHTHKLLIHSHSTHTHINSSLTPHTHTHPHILLSHTQTPHTCLTITHTHNLIHSSLTHSLSLSHTHTHTSTEPTGA